MIDHVVIMMLLRCFFRTWQDWVAGRIEHIDGSVRLGRIRGPCGPVVLSAVASRVGCTAGRSTGWLTLRWQGGSGDLPRVRRFSATAKHVGCGLSLSSLRPDHGLCAAYAVDARHAGVDRAGVGRLGWDTAGHGAGITCEPEHIVAADVSAARSTGRYRDGPGCR
jgi:hypothetical protein